MGLEWEMLQSRGLEMAQEWVVESAAASRVEL
jgi:hypothetical protein